MASASETGEGVWLGWWWREPLAGEGLEGGGQLTVVKKYLTGKLRILALFKPVLPLVISVTIN